MDAELALLIFAVLMATGATVVIVATLKHERDHKDDD